MYLATVCQCQESCDKTVPINHVSVKSFDKTVYLSTVCQCWESCDETVYLLTVSLSSLVIRLCTY